MLGLSFLSLLAACMEDLFWYSCETFVTLFQKTCTGTKQGPFSPVLNLWMNHTSQIWRIWWLEDDRNLVFTKYCSTVREIGRDVVCTHEHIHTHTNTCTEASNLIVEFSELCECQFHLLSAQSSQADLISKLRELWPFSSFLDVAASDSWPFLRAAISINCSGAYESFCS